MNKLIVLLFITLFIYGCTNQSIKDDSLYQSLGGKPGIQRLVDKAIEITHSDERIAFIFDDMSTPELMKQLEDQICFLSGGPCEYTGRDMVEAHSGLDINEAEFDIFVEDFIDAMEIVGIPHTARNKLLALLAPMRQDIIHQ